MEAAKRCLVVIALIFFVIGIGVVFADEESDPGTLEEYSSEAQPSESSVSQGRVKSFFGYLGKGVKTGGRYMWRGTVWTGKKIGLGAYYMKEGALSFRQFNAIMCHGILIEM